MVEHKFPKRRCTGTRPRPPSGRTAFIECLGPARSYRARLSLFYCVSTISTLGLKRPDDRNFEGDPRDHWGADSRRNPKKQRRDEGDTPSVGAMLVQSMRFCCEIAVRVIRFILAFNCSVMLPQSPRKNGPKAVTKKKIVQGMRAGFRPHEGLTWATLAGTIPSARVPSRSMCSAIVILIFAGSTSSKQPLPQRSLSRHQSAPSDSSVTRLHSVCQVARSFSQMTSATRVTYTSCDTHRRLLHHRPRLQGHSSCTHTHTFSSCFGGVSP